MFALHIIPIDTCIIIAEATLLFILYLHINVLLQKQSYKRGHIHILIKLLKNILEKNRQAIVPALKSTV